MRIDCAGYDFLETIIAMRSVLFTIFRNRRKSLLVRMITSVILLSIFNVTVIGVSSYRQLSSRYNREIERFHTFKLTQIMKSVENRIILPADMLAIELSLNNKANSSIHFLMENSLRQNYSYILKTQNSLNASLLTASNAISSISIYYQQNGIIVSSDSGVKFLNMRDRSSAYYSEWIAMFQNDVSARNSLWLKGRLTYSAFEPFEAPNFLTVVRTIPLTAKKNSYVGLVAVNIDERRLSAELERGIRDEYGGMLIVMTDGTVVASGGAKDISSGFLVDEVAFGKTMVEHDDSFFVSIGGENVVVTSITSDYNGWHYVYVVPERYLFKQSSIFGRTLLAICSITLIVMMLLSSLISVKLTRPILQSIKKSLSIVRRNGYLIPDQDDFRAIETTITTLSNRISELEQVFDKNREVMVASLYHNLIHGRISSVAEATQRLQFLEKKFRYPFLTVFVVQFDQKAFNTLIFHESETILYDSAERAIAECTDAFYSIEDRYSVVYVLNHPSISRNALRQFGANLCHQASSDYQIKAVCGIGSACEDLMQINRSFCEAKECIEYSFVRTNELVFLYEKIQSLDSREHFEVEAIDLTNPVQAASTLRRIKESIVEAHLHPAHARQIITSIKLSLMHRSLTPQTNGGSYDIPTPPDSEEFTDIDNAFAHLEILVNQIADEAEKRKSSRNGRYVQQVVEYVQDHVSEDISLDTVSELAGISPSHLSRIFKTTTKEGFVSYVTRIRTSKAAFSLLHDGKSIKTIAMECGFSSYSYFCKIFKQRFSMTPAEYRRVNRKMDSVPSS